MDRWFPLKTERLFLRELAATDENDVHDYASDPQVSRFDRWGPNTPEATRTIIQAWLEQQSRWPREEMNLGVELTAHRRLIGVFTLRVQSDANRSAEFGFAFNRDYWNQGYATEAAGAVLDVAFRVLGIHCVSAGCDVRNVGSYRVMEKLGLRREGHSRKDVWQKGEWRDSYRYAVLDEEWLQR